MKMVSSFLPELLLKPLHLRRQSDTDVAGFPAAKLPVITLPSIGCEKGLPAVDAGSGGTVEHVLGQSGAEPPLGRLTFQVRQYLWVYLALISRKHTHTHTFMYFTFFYSS